MVTRAIETGVKLAATVEAATEALKRIQALRKDVATLRKSGMGAAATALEKECNYNEARIKSSLGSTLQARGRNRRKARARSRDGSGKFR